MTLKDFGIKGILLVVLANRVFNKPTALLIYWIALTTFHHVSLRRKRREHFHHPALKQKWTIKRRTRFWGKGHEFPNALNYDYLSFQCSDYICNFRFMSKRRLLIISAPTVDDYSFHQQLQALNGQECPLGTVCFMFSELLWIFLQKLSN